MFQNPNNYFDINFVWNKTGSGEFPYELNYQGHRLQIRINDFPEEVLYSLLVDGEVVADFNNWPENWRK